MRRRWESFNQAVTDSEFAKIPLLDRIKLFEAMKCFRSGLNVGYTLKNYGGGLLMIKPSNRTQGRCLFFTVLEEPEEVRLIALMGYKKETQELPKRIEHVARDRLRQVRDGR